MDMPESEIDRAGMFFLFFRRLWPAVAAIEQHLDCLDAKMWIDSIGRSIAMSADADPHRIVPAHVDGASSVAAFVLLDQPLNNTPPPLACVDSTVRAAFSGKDTPIK